MRIPSWYERKNNFLFVIGGPSGSGKSLLTRHLPLDKAYRETTRLPRMVKDPWDIHLTPERFAQQKEEGRYVYSYTVPYILDAQGNPSHYGFSKSIVERLNSEDVILLVANAGNVRNTIGAFRAEGVRVIPILIVPDDPADLETRLTSLRVSSPEDQKRRLAVIREQYDQHWSLAKEEPPIYAHVVINTNVARLRQGEQLSHSALTRNRIWGDTAEHLDTVYQSLRQIITFYQSISEEVRDYSPQTVVRAYVNVCSLRLFGEPLDEVLTRFRKESHLEFYRSQRSTHTGDFLREYYIITHVEVSQKGRVIFSIGNRKSPKKRVGKECHRLFDAYLCDLLDFPLTRTEFPDDLRIDPQTKNRVFTLGDYHASSAGYTGIELEYRDSP